jgi:predicted nucleotidyltransferase
MVYTTNEIKKKLEPIFNAAPIQTAILFGSYAKGLQTSTSDIDIVIDSKGKLLNIKFYGVLEDITQCLGKRVDLIEMSEIQKDSPIYYALENEGIVLYDKQR